MARKRRKTVKTGNIAWKRRLRLYIQRGFLVAKILIILGIIAIFSLIYINADLIKKDLCDLTAKMGFVLKNITVNGHKYTSGERIGRVLKLKPGMPIFAISMQEVKHNIEQLEWVKYAVVERSLPDAVHIEIVERVPIALGQKNHKFYIIDDEGSVVKERDLSLHMHLPIVIGEGAEIYSHALINILKSDNELFKRIDSIIRISDRRWNIRFDNKLEIKLPEENVEEAWEKVVKLYNNKELFESDFAIIDLRVANKIYVEKK